MHFIEISGQKVYIYMGGSYVWEFLPMQQGL